MPVVGMGGYFFKAADTQSLKAWYRDYLGVGGGIGQDPVTGHTNEWVWYCQAGPMVFEPFKSDSDYFALEKQAMINFRVSDLDGLLASLRAAGITILREETMEGVGRFARIHDPEDNPIELWEPVSTPPVIA